MHRVRADFMLSNWRRIGLVRPAAKFGSFTATKSRWITLEESGLAAKY